MGKPSKKQQELNRRLSVYGLKIFQNWMDGSRIRSRPKWEIAPINWNNEMAQSILLRVSPSFTAPQHAVRIKNRKRPVCLARIQTTITKDTLDALIPVIERIERENNPFASLAAAAQQDEG